MTALADAGNQRSASEERGGSSLWKRTGATKPMDVCVGHHAPARGRQSITATPVKAKNQRRDGECRATNISRIDTPAQSQFGLLRFDVNGAKSLKIQLARTPSGHLAMPGVRSETKKTTSPSMGPQIYAAALDDPMTELSRGIWKRCIAIAAIARGTP